MRGIWQIILGTVLAVWRFATPGHGFWFQQTSRYHVYQPGLQAWVNAANLTIYVVAATLVATGIYRMLTAESARSSRVS